MGGVGTALEVVLGTPQAVFAIMGAFTLLGALYLLSRLGRAALRPAPLDGAGRGSAVEGVLGGGKVA